MQVQGLEQKFKFKKKYIYFGIVFTESKKKITQVLNKKNTVKELIQGREN